MQNPTKLITNIFTSTSLLITFFLLNSMTAAGQSKVTLKNDRDRFQLLQNGKPYPIKGVGGETRFEELAAMGGNSVRTWGVDQLGQILDDAHKHGLTVCAGIWLGHQRHGFSYQDANSVHQQLVDSLAAVKEHKDHPALLLWGVGNEAEGEGNDPSVWYAVNHLAREIKKIDPNHPTMTVIAELGVNEVKIKNIERFCPDIDIIGVNSYGGIESVPQRYRSANGSKPYIITEHGPLGPWEVGKTSWESPLEISSTEKGMFYARGYQANAIENRDQCLGAYSFLWGNKQETTATWFGMFLPDGTRLAAADAIAEAWTGEPLPNRCPKILDLQVSKVDQLKAGEAIQATIRVSDPDNDAAKIRWILRADSGTIGAGGDKQNSETEFPESIQSQGESAQITLPDSTNQFRLFAYVTDGKGGGAVANVPLRVGGMIKITSNLTPAKLPCVIYDDRDITDIFVPSGYMGNASAITMDPEHSVQPQSGKSCLKIEYGSGDAWGGVLWQSPAEDWDGLKPGGANLTGATQLEFWARGEQGGEKVNFVFGVLDGNQPYRDSAKGELQDVTLTKQWNRFTIPLRGLDLRQIKTGFGWSLAGQGSPVTFYLDNVRYIEN